MVMAFPPHKMVTLPCLGCHILICENAVHHVNIT